MINTLRANLANGIQTSSTRKFRSATRLLTFAAIAAFGLASTSSASAACNGGSTLKGRFGVLVSGGTKAGAGKYVDGTMTFDGACGVNGFVSVGENGTVNNFISVTGSYNTNADNTISLSLALPNGTETYDIGFSPIFGEAIGVETDGTAYATIDLKPQTAKVVSSAPVTTYNNATLKGTWAAACTAGSPGQVDLNYITIDGSTSNYGTFGNVTGVDHIYQAQFGIQPIAGQYAVLSDGTFGGSLTVAGAYPFGFTGSISSNGNELQYNVIYGTGVIEACIAKRVS
ncbi:hypothetical protein [Granulicella aggregans]|uniref:hypothetical protein n=1 Tax=Granulicella aggregans TaxID=474949 RepID=UPI0021DF4A28|nr:hypothetical protein [Granulicella aggregans]